MRSNIVSILTIPPAKLQHENRQTSNTKPSAYLFLIQIFVSILDTSYTILHH